MAQFQDMQALTAALNASTNAIAARIQALIDQLGTGGMTANQEDQIKAELEALHSVLTGMGQDPQNPIPPVA